MKTVVALGGNALVRPGQRGTAAEQLANLRATCPTLVPILDEGPAVITHGNGPQVGNALLRQERAADDAPPHPLWLAVAETQAEIGALVASAVRDATGRAAVCLLTHVVVDEHDPAFTEPTKPIGPFYDEAKARALERERGWAVTLDAGRGWRRVVASPDPLEVLELDAVRMLVGARSVAIACGGGGIPVTRRDGRLVGAEAVVDKDKASALLALGLGAERLVILTDVPALKRGFGQPDEADVAVLGVDDARALLPELEAGSMRPKLQASIDFVTATGGEALITSADALADARAGRAGTRVVA